MQLPRKKTKAFTQSNTHSTHAHVLAENRVVSQREKFARVWTTSLQNWIGKDKTSLLMKGSRHGRNRSSNLNQAQPFGLHAATQVQVSHFRDFMISQSIAKRPQQDARPFFLYPKISLQAFRGSHRVRKKKYVSRYTSLTFFTRCDITKEIQRDSKLTFMIYRRLFEAA